MQKILKAWKLANTSEKLIQKFGNFIKKNYPEYGWDGYVIDDIDGTDVYMLEINDDFGQMNKFFTWTMESVYLEYDKYEHIEMIAKIEIFE